MPVTSCSSHNVVLSGFWLLYVFPEPDTQVLCVCRPCVKQWTNPAAALLRISWGTVAGRGTVLQSHASRQLPAHAYTHTRTHTPQHAHTNKHHTEQLWWCAEQKCSNTLTCIRRQTYFSDWCPVISQRWQLRSACLCAFHWEGAVPPVHTHTSICVCTPQLSRHTFGPPKSLQKNNRRRRKANCYIYMNNLSLVTRKRKQRKPVGRVSRHYLSNVSDRLAMCKKNFKKSCCAKTNNW